MATTPLTDVLPQALREKIYALYAVIGVGIGSIQIALSSIGEEQPKWLIMSLAVFAFLGTAVGATAASNSNNAPQPEPEPEPAYDEEMLAADDEPPFPPAPDDPPLF